MIKKLIQIILITSLVFVSAIAQDQKGIDLPETDPDLISLKGFLRNDDYMNPYTSEEIQKFCDYIKENSILKRLEDNDKVPFRKIKIAQSLYRYTKDENQKKKILDLMMGMFKEIQVTRDALGVDPLSRTESWLYVDSSAPRKDPSKFKDLKEQMTEGQRRLNESNSRRNKLSNKIGNLSTIHAYLHRAVTHHMQIKLEGISPTLERSPAEKARTKDFLEKQAAAAGHKKPETKAHDK
jgi:hypothetical protein